MRFCFDKRQLQGCLIKTNLQECKQFTLKCIFDLSLNTFCQIFLNGQGLKELSSIGFNGTIEIFEYKYLAETKYLSLLWGSRSQFLQGIAML